MQQLGMFDFKKLKGKQENWTRDLIVIFLIQLVLKYINLGTVNNFGRNVMSPVFRYQKLDSGEDNKAKLTVLR